MAIVAGEKALFTTLTFVMAAHADGPNPPARTARLHRVDCKTLRKGLIGVLHRLVDVSGEYLFPKNALCQVTTSIVKSTNAVEPQRAQRNAKIDNHGISEIPERGRKNRSSQVPEASVRLAALRLCVKTVLAAAVE